MNIDVPLLTLLIRLTVLVTAPLVFQDIQTQTVVVVIVGLWTLCDALRIISTRRIKVRADRLTK